MITQDEHITIRVSSKLKDALDNFVGSKEAQKYVPFDHKPTRGAIVKGILTEKLGIKDSGFRK